jgi:hypothetical protein
MGMGFILIPMELVNSFRSSWAKVGSVDNEMINVARIAGCMTLPFGLFLKYHFPEAIDRWLSVDAADVEIYLLRLQIYVSLHK